MNKRLLLIICIILILVVVLIVLNIRKFNRPLQCIVGKSVSVSGLQALAKKLETQQDLLAARSLYQKLVNESPNSREVIDWQKKIEEINIKLLFSPIITSKSIEYEIKAGDSLEKITKDYKTTVELIMKSNNLKDDKIFPGKKIKVWTAPFSMVVDKSQNTLILKSDEEIMKTYIVSTGANNSTPVGTFKVIEKIVNPPWYKQGAVIPPSSPENILGSRWLGFDKEGYGIHGTKESQSLGKQVTAGCIRMSNPDVEELYSIVPSGTEVTIVD